MQTDTAIGCDIEEIDRFCLDREEDARFLTRIFTQSELEYCYSFQHPAPHLAVRFCAKEAVVKALCSIGMKPLEYRCIEIRNHATGVPFVTIRDLESCERWADYCIKISLSHSKTTAMAVAIITRQLAWISEDTCSDKP